MGKVGEQISVILIAIIGVATLAVILSKNANTSQVVQAVSQGFSTSLSAALSPITGNSIGSTSLNNFGGI